MFDACPGPIVPSFVGTPRAGVVQGSTVLLEGPITLPTSLSVVGNRVYGVLGQVDFAALLVDVSTSPIAEGTRLSTWVAAMIWGGSSGAFSPLPAQQ